MNNLHFACVHGTGSPIIVRRRRIDYFARLTRALAAAAALAGCAFLIGESKADAIPLEIQGAAWGSVAPTLCGIHLTPTGRVGQNESIVLHWHNPQFRDMQTTILRLWSTLTPDQKAADCADLKARLVAGGLAY
jgi:hypothetical protein